MSDALPIGTSWWGLLATRADLTPDRPYLFDDGGRLLTYGQFRERAERTAAALAALGVKGDHVVSWQLPSTIEAAVLMAALSRLGVRQNPIIPVLRRAEVALITSQVGSRWLFVPGTYRGFDYVAMATDAVAGADCTVVDTSTWAPVDGLALPDGDRGALPPATDPGAEARWYYYSSGTTAVAKGAIHTDASAMASSNAQIEYIGLRPTDMMAVPFPVTHIGGMMALTGYARVGARLLLIETYDPATSPKRMSELGTTIYGSATPFFHAYLAAQRANGGEPFFPTMRHLHAGGAPIAPELNAECLRVFGTPIYNQWGLTEFPAATSLADGDPPEKFAGSVGRMAPGAELKVVAFDGTIQPPGGEGELLVRGPQRLKGYVDASLDADAFDDDGFFRTGDVGKVDDDGFVWITGRIKDIIIRNAENISALEIENVLVEHPAIADVAVIGVPDQRTGERACAIVVLAPGHDTLTLTDLADHCASRGLAKIKIPEQIEIVEALPRNPMGKVLKHVLRSEVTAS
jgi:acyl-CoA synthetase (AMP-forming)/AMP-acid ligase II